MEDEYESWKPYGGATSFADAEKFIAAQMKISEAQADIWMMQDIMRNIANSDMGDDERAKAIESMSKDYVARVKSPKSATKERVTTMERIKARVFGARDTEKYADSAGFGFSVKSMEDGTKRWIGVYSNNFEDVEGDTFTEEAHKEFAQHAEKSGEYPELWLWHTPGTRVGVADFIDVHDGFAIASGTFDVDVSQETIDNLAKASDLGMSHGYRYKERDYRDGVHTRYRSKEISILPLEYVANPLTHFGTMEVLNMDPVKEKWLGEVMGTETVTGLKSGLTGLAAFAKKEGLSFKDVLSKVGEGMEPTEPATTTPEQIAAIGAGAAAATAALAAATPPAPVAPAVAPPAGPTGDMEAIKSILVDGFAALRSEIAAVDNRVSTLFEDGEKSREKAIADALVATLTPRSTAQEAVGQKSARYGATNDVVQDGDPDLEAAKHRDAGTGPVDPMASYYSDAFPNLPLASLIASGNRR